jgi:hypothetical protein
MTPKTTFLIATLILLASTGIALAQSKEQLKEPGSDGLVARVSYGITSPGIDWRTQEGYPQSCFALYRDGYYQVLRLTEHGNESLQGTLSHNQLLSFGSMLKNLDFESRGGGIVRNGAQNFTAEIVREGKTIHYEWMNPDNERPFPSSAVRIIEWLQQFKAEGASPLVLRELSEHPVCPAASDKPVRPLIAIVH